MISEGQVQVLRVAVEIELGGQGLDFDLSQGYVRGLEEFEEAILLWADRFLTWGEILAHQSLTLAEPLPSLIDHPSRRAVTWVRSLQKRSWASASSQVMEIDLGWTVGPLSELCPDLPTLRNMAELASNADLLPPSPVGLLAAARRSSQRQQWRLALMELGTALEALLASLLALPPDHRLTLGPLTQQAINIGVSLPPDIQKRFVEPRNDAVHRGIEPEQQIVLDAIVMVEALADAVHPEYAAKTGLAGAVRPQRQNLLFIKPPPSTAQENTT